MFGLIDHCYARIKLRKGGNLNEVGWTPENLSFPNVGSDKVLWLCFVPSMVTRNLFIRRGTLPRNGNVLIYTISSFLLIRPDPRDILVLLNEIYTHALSRLTEALEAGFQLNLLGVSLGNVLAMRLAKTVGKINTLVSIVGGNKLGLSAWDSNLTRAITRHSGCSSAEEYESKVAEFSPCHYIPNLHAKKIFARRGTHDLLIPSRYGRYLESQLIARGLEIGAKVNHKVYLGADHGSAMFRTALENYFRPFPWV